jgi:hypothetical protein
MMKKISKYLSLIVISFLSISASAQLAVTNGKISTASTYSVETPSSRANVLYHDGDNLELTATYLGPTAQKQLFADGSFQEQVGIKLRNVNECNLIYIMRRIQPNPSVSVSIKVNPGETITCGDKGYTMIKSIPVGVPAIGSTFVLSANMDPVTNIVRVTLDGTLLWAGNVKVPFTSYQGGAGIRTDNAKINFTLR